MGIKLLKCFPPMMQTKRNRSGEEKFPLKLIKKSIKERFAKVVTSIIIDWI
jgi:hypothetical protein